MNLIIIVLETIQKRKRQQNLKSIPKEIADILFKLDNAVELYQQQKKIKWKQNKRVKEKDQDGNLHMENKKWKRNFSSDI